MGSYKTMPSPSRCNHTRSASDEPVALTSVDRLKAAFTLVVMRIIKVMQLFHGTAHLDQEQLEQDFLRLPAYPSSVRVGCLI